MVFGRDEFIYMPVGLCYKKALEYGLNVGIPFNITYCDGFYCMFLLKDTKKEGVLL